MSQDVQAAPQRLGHQHDNRADLINRVLLLAATVQTLQATPQIARQQMNTHILKIDRFLALRRTRVQLPLYQRRLKDSHDTAMAMRY